MITYLRKELNPTGSDKILWRSFQRKERLQHPVSGFGCNFAVLSILLFKPAYKWLEVIGFMRFG